MDSVATLVIRISTYVAIIGGYEGLYRLKRGCGTSGIYTCFLVSHLCSSSLRLLNIWLEAQATGLSMSMDWEINHFRKPGKVGCNESILCRALGQANLY